MTNIRTIRKFALVPTTPDTKPRQPLLIQINALRERAEQEPAKLHTFATRRLLRRATARAQRRAGIYVR